MIMGGCQNYFHFSLRLQVCKYYPTLGPKVYRYDLLWAIWSQRVWVLNLLRHLVFRGSQKRDHTFDNHPDPSLRDARGYHHPRPLCTILALRQNIVVSPHHHHLILLMILIIVTIIIIIITAVFIIITIITMVLVIRFRYDL